MKKRSGRRISRAYFLIPVIYVGVIVLLLFLQFAGTQGFTLRNGSLTLSGERSNAPQDENRLQEVVVSYKGLEFVFAEGSSLSLSGSSSRSLMPIAVNEIDEGFTVEFQGDVTVAFLVREDIQELQVRPVLGQELDGAEQLLVPFSTAGNARLSETERSELVSVESGGGTFFLAAPPRGQIHVDDRRLVLEAVPGEQTVRYTPAVSPREQAVVDWFSDPATEIGDNRYDSRLTSYVDAAYQGWRFGRFNPGSGTWDVRGGSPVFDERILTAVLAEAWARDEYAGAFNDMRRAADTHQDEVGLLSSPFLGNLREVTAELLASDEARTAELLRLADSRDADLFTRPDIVQFAIDRGSNELYEAIISFARNLDYRSLDVFQAIGLLHNAVISPLPNQESQEVFGAFESVLQDEIVPRIVRTEEGYYLESSAGQIDVLASIHAGAIAEELGERRDEPVLVRMGRNLVISALAFTDESGFLPATLYVGEGSLQGSAGSIGPEEVYRFLRDNPWYPREVSLFAELGRGRWLYTVANIQDISVAANEYAVNISYPRNRTHYVIVQGVPPFRSMELFGQAWRNDPNFERYIKGRHYNANTRTLMIKYTDDSVQGDIILRY